MDTITDQTVDYMTKSAAPKPGIPGLLWLAGEKAGKGYLALAALLGLGLGAGAGSAVSYVKTRNPKITALDRKKEFYDSKIEEMENENWLNDLMAVKKKLDTSKLSDEERTALEDKYIKLINQSK